jgi:hypothetical protein
MTTSHDLSTILMAWGVLFLCVWLTKHYTRLELSNILTSGKVSINMLLPTLLIVLASLLWLLLACFVSGVNRVFCRVFRFLLPLNTLL